MARCPTARSGGRRLAILLLACAASTAPVARAEPRRLTEIPAGHWYEIPNSRLIDVAPSHSPGGSSAKVVAWSGAALDTKRSRLLVWGGGHSDYAGNEVYAFDLTTLAWQRLTDPSVADRARTPLYPDGQPRARHTYNYIEYVPSRDRLVVFGASGPYPTGGGEFSRDLIEFDPSTNRWTTQGRSAIPMPGNMIGAQARLDGKSGKVFFIGSQRAALQAYDPSRDAWTAGWAPTRVRVHATAAIDPARREFYVIGSGVSASPQMLRWNLDRPGPPEDVTGRTTGDTDIEAAYGPGFDYDAARRRLVAWGGGTDVYVLDAESLRWTRVPAAATNDADPGPENSTGTFGRFRYVPSLGLFVLVNSAEQDVFVYRADSAH
jgi:Kelch motif